jgi:transcriptional regulator with XRE-family HTH domain
MRLRSVFARNLRVLRQRSGLSQEALADAAGVDRTYVSALEREQYSASLDTLEKLADALDVDPGELLKRGQGD